MKKVLIALGIALTSLSAHADFQFRTPVGMQFTVSDAAASAPADLTGISCGGHHCLGIKDGNVWGVGGNYFGHLGVGDSIDKYYWIDTGLPATQVAAGDAFSYALSNGRVWVTGHNGYGQLGLGDKTRRYNWTDTGRTATDIAAGSLHGYILEGGVVYGSGYNAHGQLGLNHTNEVLSFTASLSGVKDIEAHYYHGLAVLDNGELYSVGHNSYGQLGRSDVSIASNANAHQWGSTGQVVTEVIPGYRHTIIKSGGKYLGVGANNLGQLGIGASNVVTTWSEFPISFDKMAAGHYQSYGMVGNQLWVVGYNTNGGLGTGNNTDLTTWTDSGLTAQAIYGGEDAAYRIDTGGTIFSTGKNLRGNAGIGVTGAQLDWMEVTVGGEE